MPPKRIAVATLVLAILGLAISVVLISVHRNLAATTGYTSFCNVSESVNCDVVLSSDYAYFAGLPIAWWTALTYAGWVVMAIVVLASARASRRRLIASVLFAVATWSFGFSLYLAVVSVAVVHAVCLLCSGLYLVNAGLFVTTWMLLGSTRTEGRSPARLREQWRRRTWLVATGAGLAVASFLIFALWEAFGRAPESLSPEEVARRYPEFHAWYTAQPIASVTTPSRHVKGGPGSVVIVEFSDFQCPHCGRAFDNLKRVLPRFGTDVQVVFHHFPLDSSCNPMVPASAHAYACLAAVASECAGAQGRFWQYHDLLFEHQSALDRDSLVRYADRLGLDHAQFLACLDSDPPREAVRRDIEAAKALGITSTPTFFLNGRTLRGALETDKFEYAIRLERAAHRAGG